MSVSQRAADLAHETDSREALEDMAAAIREQMALTNLMLQHMENNNVVANVPTVNPQFQRQVLMQPPTFRGEYNPTAAKNWLMKIERIFKVMICTNDHNDTYGTYKLVDEAEHWWRGACALLQA